MDEKEKNRQKAMSIIHNTFDLIGDAMVDSASIRKFDDLVLLRKVRDDLYQAFESIEKTPDNVINALTCVHVESLGKNCPPLIDDVLTSASLNADQYLIQDEPRPNGTTSMMDDQSTQFTVDPTIAVISDVKSWTDKMRRRVANIADSPEELDKGIAWISELNEKLTDPLLNFYMNNFLSNNPKDGDEQRRVQSAKIVNEVINDDSSSSSLINHCPAYLRGLVSSMTDHSSEVINGSIQVNQDKHREVDPR